MIKIKLLNEFCKPEKAYEAAAGLDLKANFEADEIEIQPYISYLIRTGIMVEFPKFYVGLLFSRSGLGKSGIRLSNCVGVIDSDYRGEVMLSLVNDSTKPYIIRKYDKIGQLVVVPILNSVEYVDSLSETSRGEKGFGSSGK